MKVYAYMVTSIHPIILPTSKVDDWIKNKTNTIHNQPHIPYGDNKDNCHNIKKMSIQVKRFMPTSKIRNITHVHKIHTKHK